MCVERTQPKKFDLIDLFCGVGGAASGFSDAGFDVRLGVDVDSRNTSLFSENLGANAVPMDLFESGPEEILYAAGLSKGEADLMIGCPPCQGFSSLGKMKSNDERNELVGRFGDIVAGVKPRFIAFENVPGIRNHPVYFIPLTRRLQRLGYKLQYRPLDMRDYGVPQRRTRLVCVGSRDERAWRAFDPPSPTHSEIPMYGKKRWATVRDAIADLPPLKSGERSDIPNHEAGTHSDSIMAKIRAVPKDGGSRSDLPESMWYDCHKKGGKAAGFKDVLGRMAWDEPSPTITTGCFNPTRGRFLHPEQDRAISIREAALLQTFPMSYKFSPYKTVAAVQIGNALPPRFAGILGKSIYDALVKVG